ncbi:MAG: glycosyltransferase family 2 protein [Lachnospiraceae bacterium]|jgi:glycosyltransferase involved in cell wall biosynthesis|nr:glycosyltransferase family 2 protein [Lachnospiraceae bacterium]
MKHYAYKMSIVMPSYNNGQYIRQALESILAQKVDFSYQIIITDDCSTDNSVQIIKEYEQKYPSRVLALYSNENCGLFRNMLKALKKMDGEYFCVLDPDDYWTDEARLQKAVDFLDSNPDYVIYATNVYKIYNDGSTEIYHKYQNVEACTSTYKDYLKGKSVLSNTPASTYRNIYFSEGIPQEYLDLIGTPFEDSFRADTARNLIHLKRGKAYFINENIGYARHHGNGLASGRTVCERYIMSAFGHIGLFEFFGRENEGDYIRIISDLYTRTVNRYLHILLTGEVPQFSEKCRKYFAKVTEWLQAHKMREAHIRIPFSLQKFSQMVSEKIIIWGTGFEVIRIVERYHIPISATVYFVDNDEQKQGKEFMGKPIEHPKKILEEKEALVIIASSYYEEIIRQIIDQGLCAKERIINIYDYEKNWV